MSIFTRLRDFLGLNEEVEYGYEEKTMAEEQQSNQDDLYDNRFEEQINGHPNFYRILGLDPRQMIEEINLVDVSREAEKIQTHYMDRQDLSESEKKKKIRLVKNAYDVLTNSDSRYGYHACIAPDTATEITQQTIADILGQLKVGNGEPGAGLEKAPLKRLTWADAKKHLTWVNAAIVFAVGAGLVGVRDILHAFSIGKEPQYNDPAAGAPAAGATAAVEDIPDGSPDYNTAALAAAFNPTPTQAKEALKFFSAEDGQRLKAAMNLGGANAGVGDFHKTGPEAAAYVERVNEAFNTSFETFDDARIHVAQTAFGLYTELDRTMGVPSGTNYAKALDLTNDPSFRASGVAQRLEEVYTDASRVAAVPADPEVVPFGGSIEVASAGDLDGLNIKFANNPVGDIIKSTGNAVQKFTATVSDVMQHDTVQVGMKGLAVVGAVASAVKAVEALGEKNYTLAGMNAAGSLAATASVASAACTALLPVTAGVGAVRIGMYAMDRSKQETQERIASQITKIEENKTALASKIDRTLFENAQLAASSVQSVVKQADLGIAKSLNYAANTDVLKAANDAGEITQNLAKKNMAAVAKAAQDITPQVQQTLTRMAGMMFQQHGKQA